MGHSELNNGLENTLRDTVGQPVSRMVRAALDAVPEAILLLRIDGHVEYANIEADRLLRSVNWLRMHGRNLLGVGDRSTEPLQGAIAKAALGQATVLPFTIATDNGLRAGILRMVPVTDNPAYATVWPQAIALATITARFRAVEGIVAESLARRFGLTPTEMKVLNAICDGHNPAQIALNFSIGLTTVRTHLKSLFRKTGARRQAELVRLVQAW